MPLNCGIVGLPNVGKSTIFSALSSAQAESANYPFCTINPNLGVVDVPDIRLQQIAKYISTQKIIPATVEFVDIAGLVQGASKGEGLGNRFLSHIRETGILIHVVRCFENSDIVHVNNRIDPASDIETINIELSLADLETVEKRLDRMDKEIRKADKGLRAYYEKLQPILKTMQATLQDGRPVRSIALEEEEQALIRDLHLITQKKMLYLCNVDENGIPNDAQGKELIGTKVDTQQEHIQAVRRIAEIEKAKVLIICGQMEKEIAALEEEAERGAFLEDMGLAESGLEGLIRESYKLLSLETFFTAGEKEIHAWTYRKGMKAPETAGIIHSDFEKGFIKAEIYHCNDLLELENEQSIRKAGRLRVEGKDYTVQDGDVIYFRFNL